MVVASVVLSLAGCRSAGNGGRPVVVDKNLPGGNIVFCGMTNGTVYLANELRDTAGWWFYWSFRVTGAAGRTLNFIFTNGAPIAARGPCVSLDQGRTWNYAASKFDGKSFTYVFPAGADDVWFGMTMNYTAADWDRFVAGHAAAVRSGFLAPGILCRSRHGRNVPMARVGCLKTAPRYRVAFSCRHHANEVMASYVLEGILDQVLADDATGTWLRANVEFDVAPVIDMDGVEEGDQGKNRRPHDHNRDYDEFLYPETKAWAAWLGAAKPDVYFDLHCPWVRDGVNETTYMVGAEAPALAAAQKRFGGILDRINRGGMDYHSAQTVWYGTSWNTAANYTKGSSSLRWAWKNLPGLRICSSFEFPFAVSGTATVTRESCREFGGDIARALREFLESDR